VGGNGSQARPSYHLAWWRDPDHLAARLLVLVVAASVAVEVVDVSLG